MCDQIRPPARVIADCCCLDLDVAEGPEGGVDVTDRRTYGTKGSRLRYVTPTIQLSGDRHNNKLCNSAESSALNQVSVPSQQLTDHSPLVVR